MVRFDYETFWQIPLGIGKSQITNQNLSKIGKVVYLVRIKYMKEGYEYYYC